MPVDKLVESLVSQSALGDQLGGRPITGIHKEEMPNPDAVDDFISHFPNFPGTADLLVTLADPHLSHNASATIQERTA